MSQDLIREIGTSRCRSRHYGTSPAFKNVTGEIWEGEKRGDEPEPGELLHLIITVMYLRAIGRGLGYAGFSVFGVPFNKKPYVSLFGGTFLLPLKVAVLAYESGFIII